MILIGFFVYFFAVSCIAALVYFSNKRERKSNYSDAVLGGRSVHYMLTALSAQASDMSDWLFMAFPAAIYGGGLINGWIAVGLIFGMFITWHFIAAPLRIQTEKYNVITLSSFFEKRFSDAYGIIRITSGILSIIFFSVYLAAGMKGFGFLAESVFRLPYECGTFFAAICVSFFVILGGYRTLAWIDCFQALFLLIVVFLVPAIAFFHVGGISAISHAIAMHHISFNFFPTTLIDWINTLIMAISWSVGYFGTPHILTKFMGIDDVKKMKKAQYVGMIWQALVLCAAGISGIIGIAYFPLLLSNKELIFVEMVLDLFSPFVAGFILSAVAGATLSVMSAQMLVLVSVITEDFYRFIKPSTKEKELLFVYRSAVLIVSALSFLVSLQKNVSIQSFVSYAWIGFGCSFGPLVLLALYSRFINKYGAYAVLTVGGFVAIFWRLWFEKSIERITGIYVSAVVPGFILSLFAGYLVSYITVKK